jgi:hypothetical protein
MRTTTAVIAGLLGLLNCTDSAAATLRQLALGEKDPYPFSMYSNQPIEPSMPAIKRIVILQHGLLRDGDVAFKNALAALATSGANGDAILLLAPQFWNDADKAAGKVAQSTPYWDKAGWSLGYDSVDGRKLSSFTVIDDVIRKFSNLAAYPNLQQIVVAGHSAGAQMFSRYAAFNSVHESVRPGIAVTYLLANAGTYMYFTPDRVQADAVTFAPFQRSAECSGFDHYKYGTAAFPASFSYPLGLPAQDLFKRFAGRKAIYYQGTKDTDSYNVPYGPDANCAAVLSGENRLTRGVTNARYQRYLGQKMGLALDRQFMLVEGVGHEEGKMWGAQCTVLALFGEANMVNGPGAKCSAFQ